MPAHHAGQTPVDTSLVQRESQQYLGVKETVCVYTFADGGTEEISLGVGQLNSNGTGVSTNVVPVCPAWQ